MNNGLKGQIRGYAEALYAAASPAEELAPTDGSTLPSGETSPVQITIEPTRRASAKGPLIGLAAALLVLLAAVPILLVSRGGEPDAAVSNPFVGSWETFDPDTSRIRLQLSSSGHVSLRDEAATGCERNGFGLVAATFSGTAVFDFSGNPQSFEASGDLYCHAEEDRVLLVEGLVVAADYDAVGDVMIGTAGQLTCWSRTGIGDRSACP